MYDLILRNGWIVDGTGNPARLGEVAVSGGRVAAVERRVAGAARREIDVDGALICPGFIDAHSHTDSMVSLNPFFDSTIRQGVTTEIVGNCGNSAAPFPEDDTYCQSYGKFEGQATPDDRSLGGYMAQLERGGISANLAWLVGHNALRVNAGALGETVTEAQIAAMEQGLRQAMTEGALGMSSGLEFEPGRNAAPDELMRVTAVLKEFDGIYTSHIRNRDARVLDAVREFLDVIRAHRIRGEISHLNIRHHTHAPDNAPAECARLLREARAEGLDVLADMTPLNYGIGSMSAILPAWLTTAPASEIRGMLLDPAARARLRGDCDRYWRFISLGEWERVRMQNNRAMPELNGLTFPEIAARMGKDPWDCYFDILAANAPAIGDIVLVSYLFTDEHLRETIANPLYMLVVDGFSTSADGPSAKYTRFPLHYIGMDYFLTEHVRRRHTLTLEEAIRKMTSMPAAHFGLRNRGLILTGWHADLCVFKEAELETPFDLANPCQYARGMRYVLVNGEMVLDDGEHLRTTPGRCLRHGGEA